MVLVYTVNILHDSVYTQQPILIENRDGAVADPLNSAVAGDDAILYVQHLFLFQDGANALLNAYLVFGVNKIGIERSVFQKAGAGVTCQFFQVPGKIIVGTILFRIGGIDDYSQIFAESPAALLVR